MASGDVDTPDQKGIATSQTQSHTLTQGLDSLGGKDTTEDTKTITHPDPEALQPPPNPRLLALSTKKATLEATLTALQSQRSALVANARHPSGLPMPEIWTDEEKTKSTHTTANAVIKDHIALLHRYNEIKDIGQGLMGLIAEQRGVRIARVMEDFGMGEKD